MDMNEAQLEAMVHGEGPMLVLAGPGSGKTTVITERTRYLIQNNHIKEDKILVITFTKAAATHMKERFLRLRGISHTGVNFGTFHAVFFTILKYAYGFTGANIVKEDVRYQYMKEIIHRLELEYEDEKDFINELFSEISLVKGNRMEISNYYSISCSDEIFRGIYQEYERRLRRANLIDFDDMLTLSYQLLAERPDILKLWQEKFHYILIDEFQDINLVQYEIIKMLALPQNNLFIVGDDDQSIYRFRGAKPEIMLNFPKDFPDCKQIVLNINYRSTNYILEASNRLVKCNQNRYEKVIKGVNGQGNEVVCKYFNTLAEENQAIVSEIQRLLTGGISLSDMVILVRTTHGSGSLLHKLMEYNIPFQMRDSLPNLFEHWITRDILSYIKIAMGKTERSLFLQIINRPKRYISRESFEAPEVDLDSVRDFYEDKTWVLERIEQLEYDLSILGTMNPYAAINYIRRGIGYEDYLKEYADYRRIKPEELIEVLDELQESAKNYKTYKEWFSYMEEYKDELVRQAVENKEYKKDCITIATMHSAKGLEYHTVFIADANEGITPHKKAALPADIEEERRLFYVAMTRAKELLYIYGAKERYNKVMPWSRFIDELKDSTKVVK